MANFGSTEIGAGAQLVERNEEPIGFPLLNPYAVGKKGHSDLVELAKEISQADAFVRANATGKLELIVEQIKLLQKQALNVLKEAKDSSDLHHAACNFRKIPGHVYYLYKRPLGQKYFSMLSTEDWNGAPPHEFLGAYRLEHDMSWTPSDHLEDRTERLSVINKIIDFHNQMPSMKCDIDNRRELENLKFLTDSAMDCH